MYPAIIEEYLAPTTVADAVAAIAQHNGEATVFAGGMSIMQAIKARAIEPRCIIDLNNISELRGVSVGPEGAVIGPMTRYADLQRDETLYGAYQAINDAATTVADRQIRNRGTIGGSVCWNYVAACMPPTVLALDAQFELTGPGDSRRTVPAQEFFLGALETARRDDELLTRITLPAAAGNAGSSYKKWSTQVDGLPVIGVAVYVETDDAGDCTVARFAVGGILPVVSRAASAEAQLVGTNADDADGIARATASAAEEIDPQSDRWAPGVYRKVLIQKLGREMVSTAFERAAGGAAS
ncbi:MAG: FAD binding domain-containing protein [Proteobacteria bacterium]|nr:FAD binding domain-containing protein [Pseudomonadota bacterium]